MPAPTDILAVMHRVSTAPARPWTLEALSALAGWSPAHLHRDFVSTAAETPKAWLTRAALARALPLLCDTDLSIADIAARAGFASHAVFTRTVRRVLGTTPSAIRAAGSAHHVHHALCFALYHLELQPRRPSVPVDVHLVQRDAQPVLFMRKTVPPQELQAAMAECLPAVFVHCQQHGIPLAGPPFTRYVAMSRGTFTIEAGMSIAAPAEGTDTILAGELPGGAVATAIHQGAYDTLGETHSAVEAWVAAQGRTASGPPWESYLTDPGQVPDPADWRTEICLPVE